MIDAFAYFGRSVGIMGLGRTGRSAASALQRAGAHVVAWDDDDAARRDAVAQGLSLADFSQTGFGGVDCLVWSPGIPHILPAPHPAAVRARQAGLEPFCDVDLLAETCLDAFYVGITGTNGKSTTTALIGHILQSAGRPVQVGGNLGTPVMDLDPLPFHGTYVLELSSYQLELCRTLVCDVAVWLNISADHLDRHGDMAGYIEAKKRIFRDQGALHTAVIGIDDEPSMTVASALARAGLQRVIPIAVTRRPKGGVWVRDGLLHDGIDGPSREIVDLRDCPALPGAHNWQNAAAAYATARALGMGAEGIVPALATFPGLPHRQERIGVVEGVRFVNDSKATNVDSAARALTSYGPRQVFWIAGGRPKPGGLSGIQPALGSVAETFLIGEAAEDFSRSLNAAKVKARIAGDLATAVEQAFTAARASGVEDPVVLLSPACASFDQFKDYAERGTRFAALVQDLAMRREGPTT